LLEALGVVDGHLPFEALGLDALFVADHHSVPRLPAVERMVCWFGAREPTFVRRLTEHVPGAVVAAWVREGECVWKHLLQTAGAPAGEWCAPISASEGVRAEGARALAATGFDGPPPYLFVHPGAGSAAKCWPADAFARTIATVAARTRMNAFVHQGPADAIAAGRLRERIGDGVAWLVDPSLPALAGALTRATVFVGNDSGVSHLAAALGIPSIVLIDRRNLAWRPWAADASVRTVTLTETLEADVQAVIADVRAWLG
ncbi:MAG TPA: glycosyltransferase family 9 protein, partial [Dongiaceae bacterium]|nr:glycosyltransferase family 9 protein [Dongiaceae bacterium]